MTRTSALLLVGLLTAAPHAAPPGALRVLSNNTVQPALVQLAAAFTRETGHEVTAEVLGGADLTRLLGSEEPADILIGTAATVDQAVRDGKASGAPTLIGRVGIGVMIRRGAAVPKVATAAEVRESVLAADAVAYNTAGSGQYMQKLFDQMGIAEQITGKTTRPPNGPSTMEHVIAGTGNEIGFGLRSEMTPYLGKGLRFVAMLPDDLQNYTNYDAVVLARSKSADVANAFLRYITTPAAKALFLGAGLH
jgi:molybdate transport system substrate-binding protein